MIIHVYCKFIIIEQILKLQQAFCGTIYLEIRDGTRIHTKDIYLLLVLQLSQGSGLTCSCRSAGHVGVRAATGGIVGRHLFSLGSDRIDARNARRIGSATDNGLSRLASTTVQSLHRVPPAGRDVAAQVAVVVHEAYTATANCRDVLGTQTLHAAVVHVHVALDLGRGLAVLVLVVLRHVRVCRVRVTATGGVALELQHANGASDVWKIHVGQLKTYET